MILERRLNESLFAPPSGMKELNFASANNTNYLYTTEYNVVDFSVDDNGLWVIYSTPNSNHTIVSMLSATTLEAVYSLNISINHHKVCERTSESIKLKIRFSVFLNQPQLFVCFCLHKLNQLTFSRLKPGHG